MKTLPIWMPSVDDFLKEGKWISNQIDDVGYPNLELLAKQACEISKHSYAPYSNYHVGVAIITASGSTYVGVNAERASYSETDHAEESAITSAIIGGEVQKSGRRFIRALVGTSAPCGRCRQIIAEHADNTLIVLSTPQGKIRTITSLKSIFPLAFTPTDLGIAG